MSGQVSGSGSPNLNKPTDQLARAQEAQRVGKVEEVDPDARARQQRFQQIMNSDESEEADESTPLPSPFETAFYSSSNRETSNASDLNDQKIPDPSYSSPPTLSSDTDHPLKGKNLPHSKEFWHDVDISDQPIGKPKVGPHVKLEKSGANDPMKAGSKPLKARSPTPSSKPSETSLFGMPGKAPAKKEESSLFGLPGKAQAKKEEPPLFGLPSKTSPKKEDPPLFGQPNKAPAKKEETPSFGQPGKTPAKKEETSLFGLAGKSPAKKEAPPLSGQLNKTPVKKEIASPFDFDIVAKKESETENKTDREEPTPPSVQYWTPQIDLSSNNRPGSPPTKDSLLGKKGSGPKPILEEVFETPAPKGFSFAIDQADIDKERLKTESLEGETEKKNKKSSKIVEIIMPSLPELPISVQPVAMTATNLASPYLNPATFPLFFQMVGTMTVMSTPPGISRTEITLNNPAFSNSRFFGATIEITRYASAPDSFNIRLSGTNEAVTAFNQNIPGLMAAFQTGNFNFRVGRIDVEYTTERPLLRRKDSEKGEKGDDNQEEGR